MDEQTLPDGITLHAGERNATNATDATDPTALARVEVATAAGEATVYLQGAHITRWVPRDEPDHRDVLWLSSRSAFAPGTAIRGGVPLCGPWFGPGVSGQRTPSHGWFRTSEWSFDEAFVDAGDGMATLAFSLAAEGLSARYVVAFEPQAMALELSVTAGDSPVPALELAAHTYLAVADADTVVITGLDGVGYHDKVLGTDAVQDGSLQLVGETDRVYRTHAGADVTSPELPRRVRLTTEGASSVIVWNPWHEKAEAMADMGPGEWRHMVCLEAGAVLADAVDLEPGQTRTVKARYALD